MSAAVFGTDDTNSLDRDGLKLVSARVRKIKTPIDNLTLAGEYTYQFGTSDEGEREAYGWFAEAAYAFQNVTWSPVLSYRYSRFSGDSNPADGVSNTFDPLFFGAGGGWGTWFQCEVNGEYVLFNSNQVAHQVKLAVKPTDDIGAGVIYYHFDLDKSNYFGTPVSSRNFADEVNVYMDWKVNEKLYIYAVAGVAIPQTAAKEVFGDDLNGVVEALLIYYY